MLMTSPEIIAEYRRCHVGVPSVIASLMAGRAVVRPAELVFLGTTSLRANRPAQYNHIHFALDPHKLPMRYEYLGRTRGLGTFHFRDHTVAALARLLTNSKRGQRVNSVFGEGVNPRLRKIRNGLVRLSLSSDELLRRGAPRMVYRVE